MAEYEDAATPGRRYLAQMSQPLLLGNAIEGRLLLVPEAGTAEPEPFQVGIWDEPDDIVGATHLDSSGVLTSITRRCSHSRPDATRSPHTHPGLFGPEGNHSGERLLVCGTWGTLVALVVVFWVFALIGVAYTVRLLA
jgi:hypothetical protein